jgi:glycosyltransferase involved in cell wall biosynthesis
MQSARDAAVLPSNPLVSVVVPSFNHARFVERALRSVFEQSYRHIELVVIDDGSHDGSPALIASVLRQSPFPHQLVVRDNRGAATTLNEGIALARGEFVQFLNSDDWFAESRIDRLVAAVADTGSGWGFSSVDVVDADGQPVDPMRVRWAYDLRCSIAAIPFRETVGSGLITGNITVSSGNLFVARSLLAQLGGFRQFRYNHDWDLCLRALKQSEPVYVAESFYHYRLHGSNTITESAENARAEAREVCTDYLNWARTVSAPQNTFAPALATWGQLFTNAILSGGMGGMLDASALRQLISAGTHAAMGNSEGRTR